MILVKECRIFVLIVELLNCCAGGVWTSAAHIITAVIGSGVLALSWSFAQMGWIAGPIVLLAFAWCTYYTSRLLADCYRSPHPITGKRNYIYMDAIKANLGTNSLSLPTFLFQLVYWHWVISPVARCWFPCICCVGRKQQIVCACVQYSNLIGTSIGYTIATATSAKYVFHCLLLSVTI